MKNSIELSVHYPIEEMIKDLTAIINDSAVEGKDNKIIVHVKGTVVFDFDKEPTTTTILEGIERQ